MADISLLTDYGKSVIDNAKSTAQASKTKGSVGAVNENSSEEELLDACKQFEAYLWEQIYKEVDKSVNLLGTSATGDYAGNMLNAFSDNLIQDIAQKSVSDGDNSLAQVLFEQLKRNYGIGTSKIDMDANEISEEVAESGIITEE